MEEVRTGNGRNAQTHATRDWNSYWRCHATEIWKDCRSEGRLWIYIEETRSIKEQRKGWIEEIREGLRSQEDCWWDGVTQEGENR